MIASAIVAWTVQGAINYFPFGFKSHSTQGSLCLVCKSGQKPLVRAVIDQYQWANNYVIYLMFY